jgi:uncharacterized protein YqjF (DUF2071 family)
MNVCQLLERPAPGLSQEANRGFLTTEGPPYLLAGWSQLLFIHVEIAPAILQPYVTFELDCHGGSTFVSLVGFTMGAIPRLTVL